MNRDLHPDLGPRQRLGSMDLCLAAVRHLYPAAYAEGSTGAERSFWVGKELIGHAWPVAGRGATAAQGGEEFWLRLRPVPQHVDAAGPTNPQSAFYAPTQEMIVAILRAHPLVRLKGPVERAFLVGSFAKEALGLGQTHAESDVDILLEVRPKPGFTEPELEDHYRAALRRHFMVNNIRGKMDSVHPQWLGRRVDLYFSYDADRETRPMIELAREADQSRPRPREQGQGG